MDVHFGERVVGGEVVEVRAVGGPAGGVAAGCRYLPLAAGAEEGDDVDFVPAAFVGGVGEPAAIGRNAWVVCGEVAGDE